MFYLNYKEMNISRLIVYLLLFLVFMSFILNNWRTRERFFQFYFDITTQQQEVQRHSSIDKILSEFESLPYAQLEADYQEATKSNTKKYKSLLENKYYYQLHRKDFFKFIVDDIRIYELLAKDDYYKACLFDEDKTYNWLIHPKLLYKLLELCHALEEKGYDSKAFTVVNGHRHPQYNERVGGASKSRHLQGEAIDISVGDIDGDGRYSESKDKGIVLDLLEKEIIRSEGGIGRYPGSRSVHFDVRGYKARWDKQ